VFKFDNLVVLVLKSIMISMQLTPTKVHKFPQLNQAYERAIIEQPIIHYSLVASMVELIIQPIVRLNMIIWYVDENYLKICALIDTILFFFGTANLILTAVSF